MSQIDFTKYEIVSPLHVGNEIVFLHFNAITYAAHAILPDSFIMEMKKDEKIDDFIIRVGQRAQFKLGMSLKEFEQQHAEKNILYEADEAQRIAGEKQADTRSEAIWDNPPYRIGKGRPKLNHQAEAPLTGPGSGHSEPVGEVEGEEDDRFAVFEGTY